MSTWAIAACVVLLLVLLVLWGVSRATANGSDAGWAVRLLTPFLVFKWWVRKKRARNRNRRDQN